MRDVNSGKLLGLAPNFDNNMALIARGYPTSKSTNTLLITLFNELLSKGAKKMDFRIIELEETENFGISKPHNGEGYKGREELRHIM